MRRTRVLLAEDHKVVAEGLRALLKDTFDLVSIVHDGRSLVEAAEEHKPDVIVTDVSMPVLNGLDAIRQIRACNPAAKIVVLTMHRDVELAQKAFQAGVLGYMLKVSPAEELIEAIRQVARGKLYIASLLSSDFSTLTVEALTKPAKDDSPLTARQREVLQLIAEGRTMKEVATVLGISPRTAETHKYEIMQVLSIQTTAELVHYALRNRLIGE